MVGANSSMNNLDGLKGRRLNDRRNRSAHDQAAQYRDTTKGRTGSKFLREEKLKCETPF
jgi:hypothetical protein